MISEHSFHVTQRLVPESSFRKLQSVVKATNSRAGLSCREQLIDYPSLTCIRQEVGCEGVATCTTVCRGQDSSFHRGACTVQGYG